MSKEALRDWVERSRPRKRGSEVDDEREEEEAETPWAVCVIAGSFEGYLKSDRELG